MGVRTREGYQYNVGVLQDDCLNYPHGLGLYCHGPIVIPRVPRNPIYGNGILTLCMRYCQCVDSAPDVPDGREGSPSREDEACPSEESDDISPASAPIQSRPTAAEMQCSQGDEHSGENSLEYSSHYQCDGSFYGHPKSGDCKAALQQLPDWGTAADLYREYSGSDILPDHSHHVVTHSGETIDEETVVPYGPSVKTPFKVTRGTCTVAILIPEEPPEAIVVRSKGLNQVAGTLESKCVSNLGSGGKFDYVWDTSNLLDRWIPHIFLFAKGSLMDSWLDLKMKSKLVSQEDLKSKSGKTDGIGPVPKGSRGSCSGSCLNPNDCDINSDCVCASNKAIPLSSTWGQHACMYVAGAALAIAQNTAVKPYSRCRGRCLPENDNHYNTTDILAPANSTGTTVMSLNITSPTNISQPWPNPKPPFSLPAAAVGTSNPSLFLNPSNTSSTTLPSQSPPFLQLTANLTCPCNCTYISPACCLSRTVWDSDPFLPLEEQQQQMIQRNPLPLNGSVYCDKDSGRWMPKSLERTSTLTAVPTF